MSWVIAILALEMWSIGFLVFKFHAPLIHSLLAVSLLSGLFCVYQRGTRGDRAHRT